MCGIAGCTGLRRAEGDVAVERMLARLSHRGPDAGGCRAADGWAIGARRLAILDLATGDQPVSNEDGTVHAVLNGEIYNYVELREELLARGHVLRSTGDTEVLVHLWEELGEGLLVKLRGMFALAVVDERREKLFLARDRVGKKPLYWSRAGGGVSFASELKALRESLPAKPGVSDEALVSFLQLGFVPEGECILAGVEKLPPAHWLRVDLASGDAASGRYWQLEIAPGHDTTLRDAADELREMLAESVRLRLRSDVPLAIFLSGGIDSGLVAALASREVSGLCALTATFGGSASELPHARASADAAGVELTELPIDANEGLTLLPRLAEVFDEPLADSSVIPTLLLARAARLHAKVVLNGDGGDEAFAGYRRFLAARGLALPGARRWGPVAARVAGSVVPGSRASGWGERLRRGFAAPEASYQAWGPVKLTAGECARLLGREVGPPAVLGRLAARHAGLDPVDAMRALEIELFLPSDLLVKMDRATMAASLEARSPFLDHVVLEWAAGLSARLLLHRWATKAVVREAARGLLPEAVRRGGKRGFEVPLQAWLGGAWRDEVRTVLTDPAARVRSVLDGGALEAWMSWHAGADVERRARVVFTLLTLEHWLRRWR